jgi:hypothetical protein
MVGNRRYIWMKVQVKLPIDTKTNIYNIFQEFQTGQLNPEEFWEKFDNEIGEFLTDTLTMYMKKLSQHFQSQIVQKIEENNKVIRRGKITEIETTKILQ